MNPLIIKNLSFSYGDQELLKDINLKINPGDFTLLLGENGSGKSTLLKCILGLLPYQGSLKVFGQEVNKKTDFSNVSYVPQQGGETNLSFPVNVLEFVLLGLYWSFNCFHQPRKEDIQQAQQLLKSLGLSPYLNQPVQTLSGGQKQRVFIAQALVKDPDFLILDEPTVGVDTKHLTSFKDLLKDLKSKGNLSILMVTHDPSFQDLESSSVYRLEKGVLHHD